MPSPLLRAAALVVALAAPLLPALASPAAAATTPPTPPFSAPIDRYASYQAETGCYATAQPGTVALQQLLDRTYGRQSIDYINRSCSGSSSGHEEGRALDFGLDARSATEFADAKAFISWLLATDKYGNKHAMARRLGIMYVQYHNRMWRAYNPPSGSSWEEWPLDTGNGCTSATYSTSCHGDHLHISMSWDGALKRTSYFTGRVLCSAPLSTNSQPPAVPTPSARFVPVPPTLLMYTVTGYGQPYGGCALSAGTRYDLPVLGHAGVPKSSSVKAVDLLVTPLRATAAAALMVAPSGGPWSRSGAVWVTPASSATAQVTVPVGTDGKVSLRLSSGFADLIVQVAGYRTNASVPATDFHPIAGESVFAAMGAAALAPGTSRVVTVAGRGALPASGLRAVDVHLLVRTGAAAGAVSIGPSSAAMASVFPGPNHTRSTTMTIPVASNGTVLVTNRSSTPVDIGLNVHGWYGSEPAARFVGLQPAVVVHTGLGIRHSGPFAANEVVTVPVTSGTGVPAGVRAVVLDVSTSSTGAGGVFSAWAAGGTPSASRRIFGAGQADGGQMVVPVSSAGTISLRGSGAVDVSAVVTGYLD